MRKKLVKTIESCRECFHCQNGAGGWELFCEHPGSPNLNMLEDIDIIPGWCPLEDSEEET